MDQSLVARVFAECRDRIEASPGVETRVIATESDFLLANIGWTSKQQRIYAILAHCVIRDGRLWIEQNATDDLIERLIEAGVERADLVSAWLPLDKIVIDADGEPIAELIPYRPSAADQLAVAPLSQQQLQGVTDIIGHAAMAALQSAAAGHTYLLRFAPHVAQQLAEGSARIMPALEGGLRATAVSPSGRIVGQATLVSAQSSLAFIGAAWHVAALATAQYHLKQIEARFAAIESALADIKQWLQAEQLAILNGHIRYLHHIGAALIQGQLGDTEVSTLLNQLESIDRDCERLLELLLLPINEQQRKLKKIELSGLFSIDSNLSELGRELDGYIQTAHIWLLAAKLKLAASELRGLLPVSRDMSVRRAVALRQQVEAWRDDQSAFLDSLQEREKELATTIENIFNLWQNTDERKKFGAEIDQRRTLLQAETQLVERDIGLTLQRLQVRAPAERRDLRFFIQPGLEGAPPLVQYVVDSSLEAL